MRRVEREREEVPHIGSLTQQTGSLPLEQQHRSARPGWPYISLPIEEWWYYNGALMDIMIMLRSMTVVAV